MSEISNYYNKLEVDNKLTDKVNVSEFNTANQQRISVDSTLEKSILDNKTDLDNKINLKRNIADSYDKLETDNKINLKLNLSEISNYYNKLEVDNKLTDKVNVSEVNTANQQRITVDSTLEKSILDNKADLDNKINLKKKYS